MRCVVVGAARTSARGVEIHGRRHPRPPSLGRCRGPTRVANIVLVLGGSAFVGISAQVIIPLPFTPVPLTLQTFAVLLVGAALGTWRGVASMVVYAAVGIAGVPWFSGGSSGWGGASFGYILGFIVAAGVVGRLAERGATLTPCGPWAPWLSGTSSSTRSVSRT